ncbi:MAG TPA: ATP-dependent helicase, partial [Ilumatobacteraceae bacterium]|nr:ATP-dependent helicase [Ilumatobacteraceae bacterium]
MNGIWEPTGAQQELINSEGSRFVEACPGSGKTKAIVARYERLAGAAQRRGIALLSFTNAAVDEVTARCSDPAVLAPPNFVGTFDSFINRFVTGPYTASTLGSYPRFIDSWGSIPGATVRTATMQQGIEFELDWFDWNDAGEFELDEQRVSGQYKGALLTAYRSAPAAIDGIAENRRRQLIKERLIISCAASRHIAMRLLSDDATRATWRKLLSSRFSEIIVDEAQDCGAEELRVLQAALDDDVDVTMVADLDQAIYEFRRARPDDVRSFAGQLPQGTSLTGNFRSSAAICLVSGMLRVGAHQDEAIGPNQTNNWPVRVIEFASLGDVAPVIRDVLSEHELSVDDCKVLAHRRRDAASASGAAMSTSTAGHKMLRIARAHLVLRADPDPANWRRAVNGIERLLAEVASPPGSTDLDHITTLTERLGVSDRWLRSAAVRVLHGAKPEIGRTDYTLEVRRIVQGLDWPNSVAFTNMNHQLSTPPQARWDELAIDPPVSIPWGTIHSVKGQEFEAVALVIPQQLMPDADGRTCLDLWEEGIDGESRRVLYVGATRARRLLIVATHTGQADRVRHLL